MHFQDTRRLKKSREEVTDGQIQKRIQDAGIVYSFRQ